MWNFFIPSESASEKDAKRCNLIFCSSSASGDIREKRNVEKTRGMCFFVIHCKLLRISKFTVGNTSMNPKYFMHTLTQQVANIFSNLNSWLWSFVFCTIKIVIEKKIWLYPVIYLGSILHPQRTNVWVKKWYNSSAKMMETNILQVWNCVISTVLLKQRNSILLKGFIYFSL